MNDLAGHPGQWSRIRKMFGQLTRLQAEMEDPLDLNPIMKNCCKNLRGLFQKYS